MNSLSINVMGRIVRSMIAFFFLKGFHCQVRTRVCPRKIKKAALFRTAFNKRDKRYFFNDDVRAACEFEHWHASLDVLHHLSLNL